MCWTERKKDVDIQITDKNIEVYKVVRGANKQSCKSCVQGFMYEANTLYKIPAMELKKISLGSASHIAADIIYIEKAYHSYTKIYFTLKKLCRPSFIDGYKGIIVGNQLAPIKVDNPYYVATFVIPKGSQYAINWKGEIVSNQIIYTGKHLKL